MLAKRLSFFGTTEREERSSDRSGTLPSGDSHSLDFNKLWSRYRFSPSTHEMVFEAISTFAELAILVHCARDCGFAKHHLNLPQTRSPLPVCQYAVWYLPHTPPRR